MRNRSHLSRLPVLLAAVAALSGATAGHAKLRTEPRPASAASQSAPAPKPVDINSASVDELKALPGIGDAEAARIVKGRPWRTKAHLVVAKAIPEPTFHAIKRRIVAVQKDSPLPRRR